VELSAVVSAWPAVPLDRDTRRRHGNPSFDVGLRQRPADFGAERSTANIEVITPELEKIQFTNSGEAMLRRPDRLRAHRVGGYADVASTSMVAS